MLNRSISCLFISYPVRKLKSVVISAMSSTASDASSAIDLSCANDKSLKRSEVSVDESQSETSSHDVGQPAVKKARADECECDDGVGNQRKKKVAMLLVYSGKGYLGMQRNKGFKTIESDLLEALVKAGSVRPDHIEQPGQKMAFQRAARTDKGVSAAGQVVSLKMLIGGDSVVDTINSNLPEQIRVLGLKRVTKGFDSKNSCDSRTYSYVTPTFAFAPVSEIVTEDYRMTEEVRKQVADILNLFKGTHNFHNFTSGKKSNDASAKRYIMDFTIGEPFERDGLEFVKLTVRGQSFMMHQIRKMIGITIAIMRGMTGLESIDRSWEAEKRDVPKAPGLGLVLERLHYEAYNKKYGNDGMHEQIRWDEYQKQIDDFVENFIYPTIYTTEKNDKSMLQWLATLPLHHYNVVQGSLYETSPLAIASNLVKKANADSPVHDEQHVESTSQNELSSVSSTLPAEKACSAERLKDVSQSVVMDSVSSTDTAAVARVSDCDVDGNTNGISSS